MTIGQRRARRIAMTDPELDEFLAFVTKSRHADLV